MPYPDRRNRSLRTAAALLVGRANVQNLQRQVRQLCGRIPGRQHHRRHAQPSSLLPRLRLRSGERPARREPAGRPQEVRPVPRLKPWMSEYCVMTGSEGKGGNGRDLTMNTALDVARIIHLDLTLVGVTAWQWWTAVSPVSYKDGLIFTDWKKPGDAESIITSRLLWAIGNYSRFVRPGMQRVELTGAGQDIGGLMGSAYKDEKARRVAAVYINMGTAPRTVQLDFGLGKRGWRLKSITPYVTTERAGISIGAPATTGGDAFNSSP